MKFNQLREGLQYYNKEYPHWVKSYQRLRERGDNYWLNLEELTKEEIREDVIGDFLNKWLCRVSYDSVDSLKQAIDKIYPYYSALTEENIRDIKFGSRKRIDARTIISNTKIIKEIMQYLLEVTPKFGPIPASKLMHMAVPKLFVMWDTQIKDKYGIPNYYGSKQPEHYISFLKLMKIQINHAIDNFTEINGVSRDEAVRQIRLRDRNLNMARLIDKYNFAVRDDKIPLCSKCLSCWEASRKI